MCFLVVTALHCQIKVLNNYVGIGGDLITFKPANPGPEIGAYDGTQWSVISFWHSLAGWNVIKTKGYHTISDSTLKVDIRSIENASAILEQIKAYSYYFKSDQKEMRQKEYGVLAQEVEKILPDIVDATKGCMSINYNAFIPILINGFNEQQNLIEQQQKELKTLEQIVFLQEIDFAELEELRKMIDELQELILKCCQNIDSKSFQVTPEKEELQPTIQEKAILYQNKPNPFSSNTEISFYIPETSKQAFLYIYNLQGKELMNYSIKQSGSNHIIIQASKLSEGMYLYSLVVDNEIIDSKRMILTK